MSNDLITIEHDKVLAVFTAGDGLDEIVQQARNTVHDFEHDMSTDASRKRTASLARKVASLKTTLDGMGKELVSDWKTKAKVVDQNRKAMRDALDDLKLEARAPLTEWEVEQVAIATAKIKEIEAEELRKQVELDHEFALLMYDKEMREREAAELAAEDARIAAEKEEAELLEEMRRVAAENARIEAEKKAEAEKAVIEKQRKEAEERAAQAELDRIAAEERAKLEREAAEEREAEAREQARLDQIRLQDEKERQEKEANEKREANKRHVGKIRKEAKESLLALGLDEQKAKAVVLAIHNGEVAHVTITY